MNLKVYCVQWSNSTLFTLFPAKRKYSFKIILKKKNFRRLTLRKKTDVLPPPHNFGKLKVVLLLSRAPAKKETQTSRAVYN